MSRASRLNPRTTAADVALASPASIDLCKQPQKVSPAVPLTITVNGTTTATVTSGAAPSSGAIVGPFLSTGTTYTASGSTLTLSVAATGSGSGVKVWAGKDITSPLQTAINTIAASGQSGEVFFSVPGTYLINGAPQTGTALTYAYNGQILYPAVDFLGVPALAITIRGPVRPNYGIPSTGGPQGVVLLTSASTGYVFDCIPAQQQWSFQWTGVMPIFKDIILRSRDNPTNGVINASCALRFKFDGIVDVPTAWVAPTSGSLCAIVGPYHFNNGDIEINGEIHGYPVAIDMSEHFVFGKLDINNCMTAFRSSTGGHDNWFGYVDVEEVKNIFQVTGGALFVYGHIDMENTLPDGDSRAPTVFASLSGSASLNGEIALNINGTTPGGLGVAITDGTNCACTVSIQNVASSMPPSASIHPIDNFTRLTNTRLVGTGPGLAWPTLHAWRPRGNAWTVQSNKLTASTTNGSALLPAINLGKPRLLITTITLAATNYDVAVRMQRIYNTDGSGLWARLKTGDLTFGMGSVGTTTAITATGVVSGGATVTLAMELHYRLGLPYLVRVFLNGTRQVSCVLTAAQQAALATDGIGKLAPFAEDGVWAGSDVVSSFNSFAVKDLQQLAQANSGTATLVAGSATIADANITASSVIRLNRQAAGGTLGQLSVAATGGTGFTINSSSATETSSVYWEVASY